MLLLGPIDFPGNPSRADLERISRQAGVKLETLAALSRDVDPFLAGTPTHNADAARFMSLIEFLRETTGANPNTHLRGLHYRLLSLDSTPYDGDDWEWLQGASGRARDLNLIDPWAFPDKRTRPLLTDMRGDGEEIEYEVVKPSLYVPRRALLSNAHVEGFSSLAVQPVRVIGLIEKDDDDVLPEVTPYFRRAGAELRITTGFSPKTLAARLAQDALRDPRPLVVFLITDADSAGEQMAVVTGRHLEFLSKRYDLPRIVLNRIALTLAQVTEIEQEIRRTIPPAPDYTERDEGRIELNALPVFAPGWLGRQVRSALQSVTVEIEEPEVPVPDELDDALLRAEALTNRVLRRDGWKLRRISEIVTTAVEEWEPDAPEVDVPEIDLERDWILDTNRDYLTQLNAYRQHGPAHRDTEPLVLTERLCACGCGESLAHMAVQARWLNDAHRLAASRRRRS